MPPPPGKPEAPATPAAAKPDKAPPPAPEPAAAPAAAPASAAGGLKAWLPAIAAIVLAPAATWAVAQFVLLPRLEKKLAAPVVATPSEAESGPASAEGGKSGKKKEASKYEFSSVVVNLAGTMGTRYLKVSFIVVGDAKGEVELAKIFETNRPKLYDTTLNVLSALTLADLEEAGAKNVIREKLVSAYNQVLNKRVAEQVYFSDFVVQ